jgi:hypothetical protein
MAFMSGKKTANLLSLVKDYDGTEIIKSNLFIDWNCDEEITPEWLRYCYIDGFYSYEFGKQYVPYKSSKIEFPRDIIIIEHEPEENYISRLQEFSLKNNIDVKYDFIFENELFIFSCTVNNHSIHKCTWTGKKRTKNALFKIELKIEKHRNFLTTVLI